MEPELRGIAEKLIDEYLTIDQVRYFIETVQKFKPIIESDKDAIFGWFMGMLEAGFLSVFYTIKRRTPRKEELAELHRILKRRSYEIIEAINMELMR